MYIQSVLLRLAWLRCACEYWEYLNESTLFFISVEIYRQKGIVFDSWLEIKIKKLIPPSRGLAIWYRCSGSLADPYKDLSCQFHHSSIYSSRRIQTGFQLFFKMPWMDKWICATLRRFCLLSPLMFIDISWKRIAVVIRR